MESPRCYRDLTCEAVLTESFVTGTEVSNTDYLAALSEEERERIAALIIAALLVGSGLRCTASSFAGDSVSAVTIVFRAIGLIGFFLSLFFAQRLIRDMKKGK